MATEQYTSEELAQWLITKAQKAGTPERTRKVIMTMDQRGKDTTMVGKMYFFKYDPKFKAVLLQYDKFPLCIPIERYSDGFLGLNLHYIGGGERSALIEKLLQYRNNDAMDETTKMKLSYQMLQNFSRIQSVIKPCVHRYLFSHVRSQFIEIYPDEYEKALQLPAEHWVFKK